MYLDETSFSSGVYPTYGYCQKGKILRAEKSLKIITNLSVLAAILES